MTTTHLTRVEPAEPETTWKDGAYRIVCSHCGDFVTYRGHAFTVVEAQRHERFFASLAKKGAK